LPKDSEASVVFFSINGARGFDMVKKLTKNRNHTVGNPAVHRLKRHPRHLGLLFTIKKWCKKRGRTGDEMLTEMLTEMLDEKKTLKNTLKKGRQCVF